MNSVRDLDEVRESQSLELPEQSASSDSNQCPCDSVNVGTAERMVSLATGLALAGVGLFRAQRGRVPLSLLGAGLIYRGAMGHCHLYHALGIDSAHPRGASETVIPARAGAKVEKSVTINRPAMDLYNFWRDLLNLPRLMKHLERIDILPGERSHWVAKGAFGRTVEWDAEIFNDRPGEIIAWRSLPGGDIDTAGSVRFKPLSHGRGTEVVVSLKYNPPAGNVGAWLADTFGEGLQRQVEEELRAFKQKMEAGEIPTAVEPALIL